MRTFFVFFLVLVKAVLCSGTTAVTENDPNALVEGVSVITGDFYVQHEDVIIQGAQPIRLARSYISQKGEGYWDFLSYHKIYMSWNPKLIEVTEPSGAILLYEGIHKKEGLVWKLKNTSLKGVTNTARGSLSGKYNLKNQKVSLSSCMNYVTILSSDGTKRTYKTTEKFQMHEFFDKKPKAMADWTSGFLLVEEELPNGNKIVYEWPKKATDTWVIRSYNKKKTIVYAWAKFYPKLRDKHRSKGDYGVETSDGRHFEHYYYSHNDMHQLREVSSDENPTETMHYFTKEKKCLMKAITWPQGRSLDINYYLPGDRTNKKKIRKEDPECFRVKELISPVKGASEKIVTHRFVYDIKHRKTTVIDAMGSPTIYSWNKDLRLTQIDRFIKPGVLYNRIQFIWGKNGTKDETNLMCKVLFNEKEEAVQATSYRYDKYGNVQEEKLIGNLTGKSSFISIDGEGLPEENSSEVYAKRYTYSQDGKHLLLLGEEDSGAKVEYSYLKQTCLIEEERHYDRGALCWRKINKYDGNKNLIKETTHDLNGNTCRILDIRLKSNKEVFAGMPEVIYEKAADELLKKTILYYTIGGRIERKEVYDSSERFCYDLRYTYQKGRLTEEKNALGYRALSEYDELGNKICYVDFGQKSRVGMGYDLANRLISVVEFGDGQRRDRKYSYDYSTKKDRKIISLDEYGNSTRYQYDPFGHLLETQMPGGGVVCSLYDAAGSVISYVDAMGNTTHTTHNIYNKPTKILYPDGSQENFTYYKNGTIQSHIDQNGMETSYTYDSFKRVLSRKTPYTEESFTYDSFNLLAETDAEGHITFYEYDAASRKISERFDGDLVTFQYDPLGRLYKEIHGELVSITIYDYLDRVIEERKEDLQGNCLEKIAYGYDASGDKTSTTSYINSRESIEKSEYDAFHRILKTTDALGFETHYEYEWSPHKETMIDPLGLQKIEIFNAQNKLASSEKRSSEEKTILLDVYTYDFNGNVTQKSSMQNDSVQVTFKEYDSMNRIKTLIEGMSSPEQKVTTYLYTPKGLLSTTTKSSGKVLTNIYDDLDNLSFQRSSDGSISYSYDYDKKGNLLKTTNENTKETISRSYDAKGNLIREILPRDLTSEMIYDNMGRRKTFVLPDRSSISYEYNALYLQAVSRNKYIHRYIEYDLSGRVLIEEIPLKLGRVFHDYDLIGRSSLVDSSYFIQKDMLFDPVGNLLKTNRRGELLTFAYDELYQLTQEKGHEYLFDAYHNRLSKDSTQFTVNAINQTSELEYDLDGNPKSLKDRKLTYDALDRLISIESEGEKVFYSYDSFHRRLSKKIYEKDSSLILERYYLYDGQNEIGSVDGLGNVIDLRILGAAPSAEIGSAIAFELNGEIYIPFHDLHGNVAVIYCPLTGYLEEYSYTAFGEENFRSALSPWRFSSKRTDEETGLVYYGRRYYAPEMGRWLTPDPLGLEAGPNMYAFLVNGPLTRLDLYGLKELLNDFSKYEPYGEVPTLTKYNQPLIYGMNGEVAQDKQTGFVNGIMTSYSEAQSHASLVSGSCPGIQMRNVYNPTNGFFWDIEQCSEAVLKKRTAPSAFIKDVCEKFHNDNIAFPDRKMLWVTHSYGSLLTGNALAFMPEYLQKRCIVLAIAPAKVVPKRLCHDSFNYVSQRDIVPYLHLIRHLPLLTKGICTSGAKQDFKDLRELIILKPHKDAPFFDHSFNSKTFEWIISREVKDYVEN